MKRNSPLLPGVLFVLILFQLTTVVHAADLSSEVGTILQDKLLRHVTVGVEVYRLGPNAAQLSEVLNLHAEIPLTPASNLKIATTSAALDKFGADFRFHTQLLLHDGDAVIIGDGDPTFGDAEYLHKTGWGTTTVFESWADQLQKLGISTVRDVIVDDAVFDEEFYNPRWPGDPRHPQYQKTFEAEVAGLALNTNCVNLLVWPTSAGQLANFALDPPTDYVTVHNKCVTGNKSAITLDRPHDSNTITLGGECLSRGEIPVSITIHDPSMFAATVFANTLTRKGIKMSGTVKRDRTIRRQQAGQSSFRVIAIHETPIFPVLARCNKDSVNPYAESLCKRLGFEATQAPGSWESGTAAVGAFLKKAGVPDGEFKLDDGSGLSRINAVSPHALTRVLAYDYYAKDHEVFFNSLAIAGVDGTLDDRFAERDVRDLRRRVFGKSGFIEGVSTLCGYLKATNDKWYVFSIMMNGIPPKSNSEIKPLQEKIIKAVDAMP